MSFRKPIVLIISFLLMVAVHLSQTESKPVDPEKAKEQKELEERVVQILDQIVADASFLRLPQNKAIVLAMAGELYWKHDEKRSRELFRAVAGEIMAYNLDVEREKRESTDEFVEFVDMNDPRGQVLPIIAARDAELALEMLVQTRPASLAESLLRASAPDARSDGNAVMSFNPENQRVRQEIALEQRFAFLAAEANPDKAIKMIKDSLSKGVSFNVLQLLQKLHTKDEKKASELAGEVVRKLVDTDLAKKQDDLQAAVNFLQYMSRLPVNTGVDPKKKPFAFTDAQARELASKLANTFLQPSNSASMTMALTRALPLLEKFVPDKIALLKQKQAESQRSLPAEMRNMSRMERLWSPNSTPEEILAEIPKLQNEMERSNAYRSVVGKISQITDEARARKLIDQITDEKTRARAVEELESAKISRAAATGRLEEARKMIGTLTSRRTQVQKYVALAQAFYRKGAEGDLESAKGLMKSARGLINEMPEDDEELNMYMEVVRGYASVEPDTAFKMFEPIVDQMNEVIQASSVLSKYDRRNRSFKKGELVLRMNPNSGDGLLLFRYLNQMQLLGKADLQRMNSISDRFQRSDSRIMVKLVVLQGFAREDKRPGITPPEVFMPAN